MRSSARRRPDQPAGNGAPPGLVPLVILLDKSTNTVRIAEGPVENTLLCFAMLEMARLLLYRQVLAANPARGPKIVPPDGPINLDGLIDPRTRQR